MWDGEWVAGQVVPTGNTTCALHGQACSRSGETAENNRNNNTRKARWNRRNSIMRKPENRKKNKLLMFIGLMNLESDMGRQRRRNSANQMMALQKPLTCVQRMTRWKVQWSLTILPTSTFFLFPSAHPSKFKEHISEHT